MNYYFVRQNSLSFLGNKCSRYLFQSLIVGNHVGGTLSIVFCHLLLNEPANVFLFSEKKKKSGVEWLVVMDVENRERILVCPNMIDASPTNRSPDLPFWKLNYYKIIKIPQNILFLLRTFLLNSLFLSRVSQTSKED